MLAPPDEGTAERAAYDAVHAAWHNEDCNPFCDEFMEEWAEGREFTAEDLALIVKAIEDWVPETPDGIYIAPAPRISKIPVTRITGTGHPYYYKTTTTTTSTVPLSPASVSSRMSRAWKGERTGRFITDSNSNTGSVTFYEDAAENKILEAARKKAMRRWTRDMKK